MDAPRTGPPAAGASMSQATQSQWHTVTETPSRRRPAPARQTAQISQFICSLARARGRESQAIRVPVGANHAAASKYAHPRQRSHLANTGYSPEALAPSLRDEQCPSPTKPWIHPSICSAAAALAPFPDGRQPCPPLGTMCTVVAAAHAIVATTAAHNASPRGCPAGTFFVMNSSASPLMHRARADEGRSRSSRTRSSVPFSPYLHRGMAAGKTRRPIGEERRPERTIVVSHASTQLTPCDYSRKLNVSTPTMRPWERT